MPLFGKSTKSPTEVVRNLKEDLLVLEKRAGGDPKKMEKVGFIYVLFKLILPPSRKKSHLQNKSSLRCLWMAFLETHFI